MGEYQLKDMVAHLRSTGFLKSKAVEDVMMAVDRALFVPEQLQAFAYYDQALPIGHGQTISAPGVVAFMLEQLNIKQGMGVLEIGTGSGYNTALLAELVGPTGFVVTVERVEELMELAKANIARLGKDYNITFVVGDGSCGYIAKAPYDRVIVTAGMPWLSAEHPLVQQLKPDGMIVAPVGDRYFQDLTVYDKKSNTFRKVLPVMFVQLIGECGFER